MDTRLLLVEGVPGSGKTSTARTVQQLLDARGIPNRLFLEGDLDHPADYESVARFSPAEFHTFLSEHEPFHHLLAPWASRVGEDVFIPYRKLQASAANLPASLFEALAQRDIYEAPLATYRRLILESWQRFTQAALQGRAIYIFECAFLQNPITTLLGKHNCSQGETLAFLQQLAAVVQPLDPVLLYIAQQQPRLTLERAAAERPQAWKDFVIEYFTTQGWGQAHGLTGYDGVIAFYEMRQAFELAILPSLPLRSLVMDNSDRDWPARRREIEAFLLNLLPAAPAAPPSP